MGDVGCSRWRNRLRIESRAVGGCQPIRMPLSPSCHLLIWNLFIIFADGFSVESSNKDKTGLSPLEKRDFLSPQSQRTTNLLIIKPISAEICPQTSPQHLSNISATSQRDSHNFIAFSDYFRYHIGLFQMRCFYHPDVICSFSRCPAVASQSSGNCRPIV
jgi:hypothetical protein